MKRIIIISLFILVSVLMQARTVNVAALRAMAAPGTEKLIEEELVLSSRTITKPAHENLYFGRQASYKNSYSTYNDRILYVEGEDGLGLMLWFQHMDEAGKALRYSLIDVNLKGSVLKMSPEGALSVEEIPNGSIVNIVPGTEKDIPVKELTIAQLKPEDIYSWVSVKDCEFVFKDGAYVNVLDQYTRTMPNNKQYNPNGMMDTWQTLMCDGSATPLYLVINARTPWRRTGNGVPQGKGTVSGVLIRSDVPRYGHVNAWQIRPMEESDIAFDWKGESSFKTLCEWNWNDNNKLFNTKEGLVERFRYEHMIPDEGEGELTIDFESSTYRGIDVNNPVLEPNKDAVKGAKGQVRYGSMEIRSIVSHWWNWGENCGNAVVLKFSTKNIKADKLFLAFSFSAGANGAYGSFLNPAYWGVEVSTDNVHLANMDIAPIRLRALPWWEKKIDGIQYFTSQSAGVGMTEHLIELPSSLIGQEAVYVRICPVKKNLMTLAMEDKANYALRQNMNHWSTVSFGAITIRYR